MMGFQKSWWLTLKYAAVALMLTAFWCTVQFRTYIVPLRSHRAVDSRNMADNFTHGSVNDERGVTEEVSAAVHGDADGDKCNALKSPDDRFVVFNVLPKSGSRTLNSMALNVAIRHGVDVQNTMALTNETIREKIERLLTVKHATFVYSHSPYTGLNSTERKVVHISIVRDPIERLVSLYYYKRYGDSTEPGYFRAKMDRLNLSKDTFDECVRRDGDCVNSNVLQKTIRHFCGDDVEKSSPPSPQMECLSQAKINVRNKYLVVGVMEDYMGFIRVLERLLPDVFRGAEEFYRGFITKSYFKVMKTRNKTGLSEEVKRDLKSRMAEEYEFYDYVKREFEILKGKLGLA